MKNTSAKILYRLSALLFIVSIAIQTIPVFAYVGSPYSATLIVPGSNGEILMNNNGSLGAVPNAFATTTSNSPFAINVGAYSNYPNPNGMLNTYDESAAGNPILSASFMASTTNYMQVFCQNLNPFGSCDFDGADDKGTATSSNHYFDLGIANSLQADSGHTAILPYDTYLYTQGVATPVGILLRSNGTAASSSIIFSIGMQSTSPTITYDQYGHEITSGTKPTTLTSCGTSPTVVGNDDNGVIMLGTGLSVTACTMAFANSWPTGSTVDCVVSSNSGLSAAAITSTSLTSVSFALSLSLGGGKLTYQCKAHK